MSLSRFRQGTLLFFALVFIAWNEAHAANVLVFPQVATRGGYITIFTIVNTNTTVPLTGTLAIFNQDGTPRITAVDGRGTAGTFAITVPAGGNVVLKTSPDASGSTISGMAKFTSDFPARGVVRFEFGAAQVGVLNSPILNFATLPLDNVAGNSTGVAISNPGATPINIQLAHLDANGAVLETVDPPELNPLPANGQIAKFFNQFTGFTSTANRTGTTIQIRSKSAEGFGALALLIRDGTLASTAVVRGASGQLALNEINMGYNGTWNNTTFGSSGSSIVTISGDATSRLAVANIVLGGNVFGETAPPPLTLTGTLNMNGFTLTGSSALFGPVTMVLTASGSFTITANNVTSANVSAWSVTGTAKPERITGNFTVTLRPSGTATGTVTMNNSGL